MTFRKGDGLLRGRAAKGSSYDERTSKQKPPSPQTTAGYTANVQDNLKSPQTIFPPNNPATKNSVKNNPANNSARGLYVGGTPPAPQPGVIEWRPHNGPQTRFHLSRAYETLFGGTKGPGKTDTLLREGLRQIHIPNFRAIIFRRTYPNLREIIDRSHKYFGGIGGKFNSQDHRWTFPSGASYAFGHVQHEHDKYNHNGHEYHYIGFDEVTEFTETQYLFLMAQNRTSDARIKCYIRATANPGGVGHGWVKKRFIDCLKPLELKYFKRVENDDVECASNDPHAVSREFIPATVYDNPSITENDPNYIKRLEQLPEEDKQALLYGNWDIFKGQFFKAWRRTIHVKERETSKGFFKFCALDYGYAAPSSVGWYMVDFDGNIHRYRELYKEGFTYTQLAEKVMEMTPEDEKIEYCVADPAIWGDRSHHGKDGIKGESGGETMQVIWKSFTALIKADNSRIIGWGRMRELLEPRQLKDGSFVAKFTVSPNCKDFIRTVPALIHDDKKAEDCNSDGEDHCADECFIDGTMITTRRGQINISEVKLNDEILTRKGYRLVEAVFSSGIKQTYKLVLSDGRILIGTGNHPVWVINHGFKPLQDLRYDDMIWSCNITQTNTEAKQENYGLNILEKFQKVITSITKTLMIPITHLKIWNAYLTKLMRRFILMQESIKHSYVSNVVTHINHLQPSQSFVQMSVSPNGEGNYGWTILRSGAIVAKKNLALTNIRNKSTVRENARRQANTKGKNLKLNAKNAKLNSQPLIKEQSGVQLSVVAVTKEEKEKVYNLTVSDQPEFFANGILVHNCRYAIMSRAETPDKLKFMSYSEVIDRTFDPFSKDEPEQESVDSGGVHSD